MTARKRYPVAPSGEVFDAALEAGAAERREDFGIAYERLRADHHGAPRGVVRVDGRIVPDYPHIARVFALDAGLRENFSADFRMEEKIDGYNVRIFRAGDGFAAVTRSGVICPFTQDRLPDLLDTDVLARLFRDHPDIVLCAEVAGPGNPYMDTVSPRGGDDVKCFVFDLMRCGAMRFLPLAERDALLAEYPLPVAPRLGVYDVNDLPAIADEIRRLDEEGAEGAVFKPHGDGRRVKYVCPSVNLQDVATEAALEMELPGEFYTHRLVRMVMALRELGQGERVADYGARFGEALAGGFDRALDGVERERELYKRYTVRLRDPASADRLIEHMNRGSRTVRLVEEHRGRDGDHTVLTFRKVFRRSSSRLNGLLKGSAIYD